MPPDRLPTHLLINAAIRTAAAQGVNLTVARKGEPSGGAIILKINDLQGGFRVLTQVRQDEELVWLQVTGAKNIAEREADRLVAATADFDPDAWVIEIEDRAARIWFTGRVII